MIRTHDYETHSLLDFVGLSEKLTTISSQLIPAERKKLEIACALARKPSVLLLDKVTSALTESATQEIISLIK